MNFTLRQLSYFVAAAEAGSIFHAADKLHVSQSALSAALTELERTLNTQLFVRRKARGVTLTASGVRALEQAKLVLRDANELSVTCSSTELAGPVMLGCYAPLASIVLPRLLQGFGDLHPRVRLDFVECDQDVLQSKLRTGALDVGVAYEWSLTAGLDRIVLYEAHPYVLLSEDHRLASAPTVDLADLVDEPLVLPSTPVSQEHTLSVFHDRGLSVTKGHTTTSFELTRALVGRGMGYAVSVQRSHNDRSHEGLSVVVKELSPPARPVRVVMIWPSRVRLAHRVRELIEYATALEWGAGGLPPEPAGR
ncbi:LysR family transcriptional regulator [Sphaerisporangium siamense]|uniref:DNA-binding transcriptional LysR family regulator n=1 Tax=Sphaerisporangium siamense TaxID=795645 RepID=A0A7W7G8S6_9ACTN|nr:LysR family transcriptional regulator [Sphaerisporangium siamense]MBB4699820.1 DNA-binding transcriptional LysR family regulator [Sphaerisporangium siamense]GII84860.1 LysR family transcriptional regulator [Sphaerisporangium siamense]